MTDQNGTLGNEQGQVQGTGANGPWAEDLNSRFEDEAQRQAVDAFLREKVQPYVTQLEQESRPALELYKDLRANPAATYVEITEDLFGEDEAKAISAYLESRYNDEQQPVVPDNQGAQPNTNQGVTDPRIQEMLSDWEERRSMRPSFGVLSPLKRRRPRSRGASRCRSRTICSDPLSSPRTVTWTERCRATKPS
jgi:hypothetical protein